MNAIVAIGGRPVFAAVDAYRVHHPSAIWVLGSKLARDKNDYLLRSLDALIEPYMDSYFAGEARDKISPLKAQVAAHPSTPGIFDGNSFAGAVLEALDEGLESAFRYVVMLDRAHAIQPIELVFTDDGSPLARTATAWARARGLPALMLPDGLPLLHPVVSPETLAIAVGARARQMYRAIGVADSRQVFVPAASSVSELPRADTEPRRNAAKAAVTTALGWPASDVLVVFEPSGLMRYSAHEQADAFRTTLADMFAAYVFARDRHTTLRLAVLAHPSADALSEDVIRIAAAAGLPMSAFAYARGDLDFWVCAADIVVSIDSPRSMEAAAAGIPAVNLWQAASWYLGPPFAAEDGILGATRESLGTTLAALAGDANLRGAVARIARERIALEAPTDARVALAIAAELIKLRQPPTNRLATVKPDIVIYAPDYTHASAGIRALYRLCHIINLLGGNASITPATVMHPTWNTPRRDVPFTDQTIVVFPEVANRQTAAKRVVRWVLNKPGLLAGPTTYDDDEMVFYYPGYRASAQTATSNVLTDERELPMITHDPELFYNDRSRPRLYDCVYIGKGQAIYDRVQPREIRDAFIIRRGEQPWPASRTETAYMLRGCRCLYTFDAHTMIADEAMICGSRVIYVREDGEQWEDTENSFTDYVSRYYDFSHVERFLRLVSEHWD